eukprot:TRINITY_DN8666_c0_g1_i4.p1 TRINITY_DN8666_c0_g1~~TRINITY_DN8666_c0_g1_i4.p1  ORF type:complete len:668 (+),score=126.26 TRINITY_DN8666_c0_g1_i4:144-2147(+)
MCSPYEILCVDRNVSEGELRSAYRRRALETHPDKGGSGNEFRQVVEAFETLCDVFRQAACDQAEHFIRESDRGYSRAATRPSQHAPRSADAGCGGDAKRRRFEKGFAGGVPSSRASPAPPAECTEKGRVFAAFSKRAPAAAPSTNTQECSAPTSPTRAAPTSASSGDKKGSFGEKPLSVLEIIEELFKMGSKACVEHLDQLSDPTLAEMEAFLCERCNKDDWWDWISDEKWVEEAHTEGQGELAVWREEKSGAEQDYDVHLHQTDEQDAADANSAGNDVASLLALEWGDEGDGKDSAGASDTEPGLDDEDIASGLDTIPVDLDNAIGAEATRHRVATATGADSATNRSCGDVATPVLLTPQHVVRGVLGNGATAAAATAPSVSTSQQSSAQSHCRGVSRCRDKFYAAVSVGNVLMISNVCPDLATAIDSHIALVRLRQSVIANMQKGVDFKDAMREVDAQVTAERHCHASGLCLSYRVQRGYVVSGKYRLDSKQSRNIDEVLETWEKYVREREAKRATAQQKRLEEQRKRLEEQRKRSEKAASCHVARRRRKLLEQGLKRSARSLQAIVKRVIQRREKALLGRWGVRKLPKSVEKASLWQSDDSLCAVLQLSDGSTRRGPLRQSFREAEVDATDFLALQRKRGDVAACAELERRDETAMAAYFVELL